MRGFAAALLLFLASLSPVYAITIQFQAVDLTDTTPGQDLWQYTYRVSNYSFLMDEGFFIAFDPDFYRVLEDPAPPVNPDWDPLVFQPNKGTGDAGLYDALAFVDDPSLNDGFSLTFLWLGKNQQPGAQPFGVYDSAFQTITTGMTQLVSPVDTVFAPPTLFLLLVGGLGLIWSRVRARSHSRNSVSESV